MEANKENVHRTRIPLPKDPLPALPRHLVVDNKNMQKQGKGENQPRGPLKTLNSQGVPQHVPEAKPGPSRISHDYLPIKMDTNYVTIRAKREDLDWSYSVFRDTENEGDENIITVSDDEVATKETESQNLAQNHTNNIGALLSVVTPDLKGGLESNRIKKMKRSLKRPHSRELQGLSPIAELVDRCDEKAKRRLQFNESLHERFRSPDYLTRTYMKCMNRDYTLEVFSYLLAMEKKPLGMPRTSSITRACVINWLMKVNILLALLNIYGQAPSKRQEGATGNPATIQTACWYLDSLLSTNNIQVEKLQLVAAACYWIAQKWHGNVSSAGRIVRYANKAFPREKLLAAEKTVLLRLKFPTQAVVPQEFINYLSWWCDNNNAGEIEIAATFLCQCGIMVDKAFCDEYPSVIAAAAVRNALLLLNRVDLLPGLEMSQIYQLAEKKASKWLYSCSVVRKAVCIVAGARYEYKTPLEHYGGPPNYIAQRIVNAALESTVVERVK